ncbi:hypothetical protein [Burkholderia sp. Nafp2/4-1b]|uniref:hypothetical protein n=1 Tax=Burkholderia sp. Nafp2/4-1b TaxID=2116686 RepID=UPI0013CF1BE5|nr:hypothetical protein [Burkholderia sp. Nafp2/4-1b]
MLPIRSIVRGSAVRSLAIDETRPISAREFGTREVEAVIEIHRDNPYAANLLDKMSRAPAQARLELDDRARALDLRHISGNVIFQWCSDQHSDPHCVTAVQELVAKMYQESEVFRRLVNHRLEEITRGEHGDDTVRPKPMMMWGDAYGIKATQMGTFMRFMHDGRGNLVPPPDGGSTERAVIQTLVQDITGLPRDHPAVVQYTNLIMAGEPTREPPSVSGAEMIAADQAEAQRVGYVVSDGAQGGIIQGVCPSLFTTPALPWSHGDVANQPASGQAAPQPAPSVHQVYMGPEPDDPSSLEVPEQSLFMSQQIGLDGARRLGVFESCGNSNPATATITSLSQPFHPEPLGAVSARQPAIGTQDARSDDLSSVEALEQSIFVSQQIGPDGTRMLGVLESSGHSYPPTAMNTIASLSQSFHSEPLGTVSVLQTAIRTHDTRHQSTTLDPAQASGPDLTPLQHLTHMVLFGPTRQPQEPWPNAPTTGPAHAPHHPIPADVRQQLVDWEFTDRQIASIADSEWGLRAVWTYHNRLSIRDYTARHVAEIATAKHPRGLFHAICWYDAVLTGPVHPRIGSGETQGLGLSRDQVVEKAKEFNFPRGFTTWVMSQMKDLYGYAPPNTGSRPKERDMNLLAPPASAAFYQLRTFGYPEDLLREIHQLPSSRGDFAAILERHASLTELGYTPFLIATIATGDRIRGLDAVLEYHAALKNHGYTVAEIARLAVHHGERTLKSIAIHHPVLTHAPDDDPPGLGLARSEVGRIASRQAGGRSLTHSRRTARRYVCCSCPHMRSFCSRRPGKGNFGYGKQPDCLPGFRQQTSYGKSPC